MMAFIWGINLDKVELRARLLDHLGDALLELVWHESHESGQMLVSRKALLDVVLGLVVSLRLVTNLLLLLLLHVLLGLIPHLGLHLVGHLLALGLGLLDKSVELGLVGNVLLELLVLAHHLLDDLLLLLPLRSVHHERLDKLHVSLDHVDDGLVSALFGKSLEDFLGNAFGQILVNVLHFDEVNVVVEELVDSWELVDELSVSRLSLVGLENSRKVLDHGVMELGHFIDKTLENREKLLEVSIKKLLVDFARLVHVLHRDSSDIVNGVKLSFKLLNDRLVGGNVANELGKSLAVVSVESEHLLAHVGLDRGAKSLDGLLDGLLALSEDLANQLLASDLAELAEHLQV